MSLYKILSLSSLSAVLLLGACADEGDDAENGDNEEDVETEEVVDEEETAEEEDSEESTDDEESTEDEESAEDEESTDEESTDDEESEEDADAEDSDEESTEEDEDADTAENGDDGEVSERVQELQENGISVGFSNEPPYAYMDTDSGELQGAAIDIATAVFEEMGITEMEGRLTDWAELIPGVQAGQYDAITAGMAILPDRCETALFANPEMQYGEGLVVAEGNPEEIYSYADIADNPDITVALMSGTMQFDFLEQEGVDIDNQVLSVADIPGQLAAVQSGNADVTAATENTLRAAYESLGSDEVEIVEEFEQPDIVGIPSYGAVAFALDDEELRDAYNEALEVLIEDGTIDEILDNAEGFTAEANRVEVGEMTAEELCAAGDEEADSEEDTEDDAEDVDTDEEEAVEEEEVDEEEADEEDAA